MKLIINIKCYCEFVICFYFCSGLTEHKNERKRKRQDFYSMLFLMTLMRFFMVKTFHHHEEDAVCHSDSGNSHDSSHQCPVCNFTLSPFTQVETLQLHIVLPVFDYQPKITVDKVCQVKSYPYYLRAPPVC